jgi:hypothetical protein
VLNNLQLKDSVQEEEDYVIFSDEMFKYFYAIYGGTDIRRQAVSVDSKPSEDDSNTIIETKLRKLQILIAPIMDFFPTFSKSPFTVYISRCSTVGELHQKIL